MDFGGETLLERALNLAGSVTPEVVIVGEQVKFSRFGKVVEDVYRDCGPLGGIHAALAGTSAPLNLVLAVDMPFVQPGFLAMLAGLARETDADGDRAALRARAGSRSVPSIGGSLRPTRRRPWQSRKNKIDVLFPQSRSAQWTRRIGERAVSRSTCFAM